MFAGILAFSILSSAVLAQDGPLWSDKTTGVASGSAYEAGKVYSFGIVWVNDTGGAPVISNVTFETNLTTGTTTLENITKADVTMYTTFTNDTSGVWNITFTQEQLGPVGGYVFKWYANDTADVWNSTDQWAYTIAQGTGNVSLYLDGTEGDRSYTRNQDGNITVSVNISYTVKLNVSTNFTSTYNTSGDSPLDHVTTLSYSAGKYNITGFFEGDVNYTSDSQTYWLTITTPPTTTTTTTPPYYPEAPPSPVVSTTPGKAVIYIPAIAAGSKANVTIEKTEGVDFTEITITVRNKVNFVYIKITKLDARPSEITDIPGKVYHYINIVKDEIEDDDISSAEIRFKVEKSWLSDNVVNELNIVLNRYGDGAWSELPTTKLSEDDDYVYYEAETTGLSYFAISERETAATTTTTTGLPATTTTMPPAGRGWYPYFVLAIVVLAVILYLGNRYYKFMGSIPIRS